LGGVVRQVEGLVHLAMMDILLNNLAGQSVTVTHLFLGFAHRPEDTTQADLASNPDVLRVLQTIVTNLSDASFVEMFPVLAERGYQLLYSLCQARRTRAVTLTLLQRDGVDFFEQQFRLMTSRRLEPPKPVSARAGPIRAATLRQKELQYSARLHIHAWLLKCIAVALRFRQHDTDHNKLRTLFTLLFSPPDPRALGPATPGQRPEPRDALERTGLAITEVLADLRLLEGMPEKPDADAERLAVQASQPLPGPREVYGKFRFIVLDVYKTLLQDKVS
jgi:hypothetical protein